MDTDTKTISLTTWLTEVQQALEDRGMDTVFRLFDPVSQVETYMLTEWGLLQDNDMTTWITSLSGTGVMQTMCQATVATIAAQNAATAPTGTATALQAGTVAVPVVLPVDLQDMYNLSMSAKFLQNSVSLDLWMSVEKDLPTNATGPEILFKIITSHQMVTSSAIRTLVKKLEAMNLKAEPGENVLTFSDKLSEMTRRIEGSGQAPRDLSVLVASRFLGTSTIAFEISAAQLHNEVDLNPNYATSRQVIARNKSKYRSLNQQGLWDAHAIDKTSIEIQGLKAELKNLKTTMTQPPEKPANERPTPWRKTPPSQGELHTQGKEGVTWTWCATCKHWNKGDRAHLTAEHVVGFLKKKREKPDAEKKEEEKANEAPPETPAPSGNMAAGSLRLTSRFLCMPGLKD